MKTRFPAWFALGFLLSYPIHAQDDDPFAGPLPHVRVQVEYIEVSHEQLTELMFGEKPSKNDTELRKVLGQMAKDGKAKFIETQLLTCRDGKQATTESVKEFIYPTEYDPPEIPLSEQRKGQNPKADATQLEAIGPNPTAFETRNLGPTLEVETHISDDQKKVSLTLVSEIVDHVGNTVWLEWKGKYGNSPVQMPSMYTVRFVTRVNLTPGKPMLAAVLTPKDKDGNPDPSRKYMVFVRCDLIDPGQ